MKAGVAAVEMCEVVAGSPEAFQLHPFATCCIKVTSGLAANEEALQKCMYLAEKGLPQLYIPLNSGGVNSPATIAGCEATMTAGVLLECTGFPPFARALQRDIDIPIFSWGNPLDYAYSVVVHRDYYGHV